METFHWSSGGAGLIFVAYSVPSFAGVYIGKLISRTGARIPGTVSFLVASCSWILMRIVRNYTPRDIVLLIGLLLVQGLAMVTIEITAMTEVSKVVEDYEIQFPGAFGDKPPVAQAYALFNMAFACGQLLGPILAGGIRVHAGWSTMTLILGLLCSLTAIPYALFGGSQPRASENEQEANA